VRGLGAAGFTAPYRPVCSRYEEMGPRAPLITRRTPRGLCPGRGRSR
jgi:hypothetical protein